MTHSTAASDQAGAQRLQQRQVRQATGQINTAFKGFTPDFYNNRAQQFENFALPQLSQQFGQARNQLGFQLANRGQQRSSVDIGLRKSLQEQMATNQQGIANQGISQAQDLQRSVEGQRANLIGQANAASDPASIAVGAYNTAAGFSTPSAFAPIGPLFQNWMNTYLAGQQGQMYNQPQVSGNSGMSTFSGTKPFNFVN